MGHLPDPAQQIALAKFDNGSLPHAEWLLLVVGDLAKPLRNGR